MSEIRQIQVDGVNYDLVISEDEVSATSAAESAAEALSYKNQAATSATNAATSATNAATSAVNAANSAEEAIISARSAESAAYIAGGVSSITDPNEDGNLVVVPPNISDSGWAVRYDVDQTALLSAGEQAQARKNIAAGGTNPNLLDNPFFFVNQRSFTSQDFGSSNGYTVDRWKAYRSSVTVKSDGSLDVTPNANDYGLAQFIDAVRLVVGETYTASANIGGDVYTWTFVYTTSAEYSPVAANGSKFYRHTSSGLCDLWLVGTANTTYNLRSFKLEKGAFSTLANDAPPDYGTELMKCQYYFERIKYVNGNLSVGVGAANGAYYYIPIIIRPKRNACTITMVGSVMLGQDSASITVSSIYTSGTAQDPTSGHIHLAVQSSTSSAAGTFWRLILTSGAYIDFSAEP